MKYLLALFSFMNVAWGCEIYLPHNILFLNKDEVNFQLFKSKDCSEKIIETTYQILTSMEGRVPSYQIKEILSNSGFNLAIYPQSVQIQHLNQIVKDQLHLPEGISLKKSTSIHNQGSIALTAGDQIEVQCNTCTYQDNQTLYLKIRGFDGQDRNIPVHADFKKLVKAYRLMVPITSFNEIQNLKWLQEEMVEEIPHVEFISNIDDFKFYKTNKTLKAGELLKKADFNAVKIVRAGLKTDVVLENSMVRIKTQGISRANGAIGEFVEVYHPQKNKKYQGRVIDINKVLVEL